jgi:hypothetical protein
MNLGIGGRVFAILIGLNLIGIWVLWLYDDHPREGVRSVGPYAMTPSRQ